MSVVLIVSNTAWSIFNFRAGLIAALRAGGFRVVAVAPPDAYADRIPSLGCVYVPLPMDNRGRNPFLDAVLFARLLLIFAREKPSCVLSFTVKPNIYGSIAARLLGIPVVANIAGLGSIFVNDSPTQSLVRWMYRTALARSQRIFFQNPDDQELFVSRGIVKPEVSEVLPGSGVNTTYFSPRPQASTDGLIRFLFMGRLLREKGVSEFIAAARALRSRHPMTRFQILGFAGITNPSLIGSAEILSWVKEGIVENLGETDDVRPYLAQADCIVLPSYYREGVPRSLLEAASMGKPIITTDMPGCRAAVVDGKTGFLVKPRDVPDLVNKMAALLDLPKPDREVMGKNGRQHIQKNFDEQIVIARYLQVVTRGASQTS